ncbi:MAG: hypothetical protein Q9212_005642 [Teloschistes hypoglaucus]
MAPAEITEDYYAVLEVSQTASSAIIRKSYRRLALLRAYETTSDPAQRRLYDIQWEHIRTQVNVQQEAKKHAAEAAETERKDNLNKQREQKARSERLERFYQHKSSLDRDIFELNRVVTRLTNEIKRLQEQDEEEKRRERANDSWWTFVTSPIYGKTKESDEMKQRREEGRRQRLTSRYIKGFELEQKEARLKEMTSSLLDVEMKIAAEKRRSEDEARAQEYQRQEKLRQEQEIRRRQEQEVKKKQEEQRAREFKAEWERAAAERQRAKAKREEEAARKMQEAMEDRAREQREQRAREDERAKAYRKAEAFAQAAEAARQKSRAGSGTTSTRSKPTSAFQKQNSCQHRSFWPKLEGSFTCSRCLEVQRRFVFQCPGCETVACANCRQILRGERSRPRTTSKRPSVPHQANTDNNYDPYSGYDWD